MGTIIAGVLVSGVLLLAIRSMVRKRREGKRVLCGSCKDCGGRCHCYAALHKNNSASGCFLNLRRH